MEHLLFEIRELEAKVRVLDELGVVEKSDFKITKKLNKLKKEATELWLYPLIHDGMKPYGN